MLDEQKGNFTWSSFEGVSVVLSTCFEAFGVCRGLLGVIDTLWGWLAFWAWTTCEVLATFSSCFSARTLCASCWGVSCLLAKSFSCREIFILKGFPFCPPDVIADAASESGSSLDSYIQSSDNSFKCSYLASSLNFSLSEKDFPRVLLDICSVSGVCCFSWRVKWVSRKKRELHPLAFSHLNGLI